MSDAWGSTLIIAAVGLLGIFLGIDAGEDTIKKQAFQRGYMVECKGKTGYHWECDK